MESNEHYRIQSDRLHELAEAAASAKLRETLLTLARRYQRLAARVEKKAKSSALH